MRLRSGRVIHYKAPKEIIAERVKLDICAIKNILSKRRNDYKELLAIVTRSTNIEEHVFIQKKVESICKDIGGDEIDSFDMSHTLRYYANELLCLKVGISSFYQENHIPNTMSTYVQEIIPLYCNEKQDNVEFGGDIL